MIYLDTGCLLKLYYPEANSRAVAVVVRGKTIAFTALHELEPVAALQLKRFRGEASQAQADAAVSLVRADLTSGKLVHSPIHWSAAWRDAPKWRGPTLLQLVAVPRMFCIARLPSR